MQSKHRNENSQTGGLVYSLELKINDGDDDDDDYDELFCGMVDRRKAFSLISSRDHCQRSSPSRAGFEPVEHIGIKENEVIIIYLELDDKYAGQIRMSGSDIIAKNNKWVAIKRDETYVYLNKYKTTSPATKEHSFL